MLQDSKLNDYLIQWTYDFMKNKDIITKNIEKIDKQKNGCDVWIKYKDKELYCWVKPFLENVEEFLSGLSKEKHHCLVVYNTNENFVLLKKFWRTFVNIPNLRIYFVNPFSSIAKKWIIAPATHELICDDENLMSGLDSLFEGVEITTKDALERNI